MTSSPEHEPEGLFTIGEVIPSNERGDMSSVERMEFLIESLDLFDKVADIESTIKRFKNPSWLREQQEARGKAGVYAWRRKTYEKHQETLDSAKQLFSQGFTAEETAAFGTNDQEVADEIERQYGIFESAYRGTSQARHKKREEARQNYRLHMESGASPESETSDVTLAAGNVALQSSLEPELAKTKDKLIGLRDDTRANFVPTTHTEKNQAFEILDYMNLSKYPKGVTTRLDEIFYKQQRDGSDLGLVGKDLYEYGLQSITSITYEWADHLKSAMMSHEELAKLKELLDSGINPHISTLEALDTEPEKLYDYNVLVRFANLKSLRDGKAFHYDPLRTREDRTLIHPDKNKIIEDVHTELGSLVQIQEFIDTVASELNVRDSRTLINEAIDDQANRRQFWYRALRAVADFKGVGPRGEGFQEQALQALKSAGVPLAA